MTHDAAAKCLPSISEQDAGVKFGPRLKAFRLGWRWSPRNAAWLRLSFDATTGAVAVELAPVNGLPATHPKSPGKQHVCWWEAKDSPIDHCPQLRAIRRVKRYFKFYVD